MKTVSGPFFAKPAKSNLLDQAGSMKSTLVKTSEKVVRDFAAAGNDTSEFERETSLLVSGRFKLERYDKYLLVLLGTFFLFHLVRNFFIAPYVDESFWWLASRRLAAGYFMHPPWFAVEMRFFTAVFGTSAWGLKSVSLFFSTALLAMVYVFAKDIFGDKKWAFLTALLFALCPITNSWLTIGHHDATLAFFTLLTTWLVWRAVNLKRNGYWYLAGLSGGILLLTKLQSVLLFLGILLFLVASRKNRFWLRKKEPYLALLIVAVMFVPTFLWYLSHHFEPVTFQLSNRPGFLGNGPGGYIKEVITHAGWEMAMFSPFVYLFSIFGLIGSGYLAWKEKDQRFMFLFWLSAPIIAFFTITGGQYYWGIPGHAIALVAAVGVLSVLVARTSSRRVQRYWFPAFVVFLLIIPLAMSMFFCYFKATYSGLHNGWEELAAEIDQIRIDMPGGHQPYLMGPYYHLPSEIAFYERGNLAGYSLGFRVYESSVFADTDQYSPWIPLDQLVGKNVIFVDDKRNPDNFETPVSYWEQKLPQYFESVDPPVILEQKKGGMEIHTFYIFKCYGFKGPGSNMNVKGEIKKYMEVSL
jgi:hypothetical protein